METSAITGESEPVEYQADAVNPDVIIFDSRNVAFNGSMCVDGEGTAIVIKTASDTVSFLKVKQNFLSNLFRLLDKLLA